MLKFLKVLAITLYCLTATVYADDAKIKEIEITRKSMKIKH